MTIDELARRAGTTTRNVRAHQTRGLLPPPRMVGRTGHYGSDHLVRLAYIDRLQQRGFSLAAIRDLLKGWDEGRSLTEVLGFEDALTAPWSDETPEHFSRAQLVELFPEIADDARPARPGRQPPASSAPTPTTTTPSWRPVPGWCGSAPTWRRGESHWPRPSTRASGWPPTWPPSPAAW